MIRWNSWPGTIRNAIGTNLNVVPINPLILEIIEKFQSLPDESLNQLLQLFLKSKLKVNNRQIIKSFNELSIGSLVVHENHGIGKYIGVDQLVIDGLKKEISRL